MVNKDVYISVQCIWRRAMYMGSVYRIQRHTLWMTWFIHIHRKLFLFVRPPSIFYKT